MPEMEDPNMILDVEVEAYTSNHLVVDLAKAIAMGVSGVKGTLPEPEDHALAEVFAQIVNNDQLGATVVEFCRLYKEGSRLSDVK